MLAVSLRRFRHEAEIAAAAIAGVCVLALVTGMRMNGEYRSSGLADCLAVGDRSACQPLIDRFGDRFSSMQVLIIPLVLLPALLGAFVGAPLVAREIEGGTHRFLWTQGVTRRRWFTTSALVASGLAIVAGALYAVIAGAWLDTTNRVTDERFTQLYDFQGIVPVAASVFAVAVGIACGVMIRRTVPAMVATLGVFVAVRVGTATFMRPRLATPLSLDVPYNGTDPLAGTGAWKLSHRTIDQAGAVLGTNGSLDITGLSGRCPGMSTGPGAPFPEPTMVDRCLRDLDVRTVISYHPGDRFWNFQLLESGILLGLAVAAFGLAADALRRRAW